MKILISGYYGFGNLGDESLFSALKAELVAAGHSVTILSNNPKLSSEMHNVKSIHRYYGLIPAIINSDVVISGGGGLLQNKTSTRSLQYYLLVIKIAKLLKKKLIVFAQSVGPLDKRGKTLVKKALRDVFVAVRDKKSQDLLSSLGIDSILVADTALLLQTKPTDKKQDVLFFPRAGYPDISAAAISLIRNLNTKNLEVSLAAIHAKEDEAEINRIIEELPNVKYLKSSTPGELLELISKHRYVVSARLHGLILAAVAKTDYCGIVYDPKVAAFLEDTGARKFELPLNHLALSRHVLELESVDSKKLELMRARAQSGIDWLLKIIDSS